MTKSERAKWIRLCCGQRHLGPVCPDGGVMCCGCFEKFYRFTELSIDADGYMTDVCVKCADEEESVRRRNQRHEMPPQKFAPITRNVK